MLLNRLNYFSIKYTVDLYKNKEDIQYPIIEDIESQNFILQNKQKFML